jgi:predicted AAA+ superfamily ATPase
VLDRILVRLQDRMLYEGVVPRLAGKNDKAVRQLELTYGGGKTHTRIAMRHLWHPPIHDSRSDKLVFRNLFI